MTFIAWEDKYSINNIMLDNHHRRLFSIFDRLNDICSDDFRVSMFDTAINELLSYTNYHFNAEEQYMRKSEYNDIELHTAQHKYFISKILDINADENKDNSEHCRELIYFLGNWLKNHVIVDDKKITI